MPGFFIVTVHFGYAGHVFWKGCACLDVNGNGLIWT